MNSDTIQSATIFIGELPVFWCHLSQSGMIGGNYAGSTGMGVSSCAGLTNNNGQVTSTYIASSNAPYIPETKIGNGNYIIATSDSGFNNYIIGGFGSPNALTSAVLGNFDYGNNNLSPIESYNIDKKIDDGFPSSGKIKALDISSASGISPAQAIIHTLAQNSFNGVSTTACVNSSNSTYQNTTNSPLCSLIIRFK